MSLIDNHKMDNYTLKYSTKLLALALLSLFVTLGVALFLISPKVQAGSGPAPPFTLNCYASQCPITVAQLPGYVLAYLLTAPTHYPRTPAYAHWISPASNASTTILSVPYGTTSVNLSSNVAGAIGFTTDYSVPITLWTKPVNIPGTTQFVSTDKKAILWDTTPGSYASLQFPFSYTPSGGFTASAAYLIQVFHRSVNVFHKSYGDVWGCVGAIPADENTTTEATWDSGINEGEDGGGCKAYYKNMWIYVNISTLDSAPNISVIPDCSARTAKISVTDDDGSTLGMAYHIWKTGTDEATVPYTIEPPKIPAEWTINMPDGDGWNIRALSSGVAPDGTPGTAQMLREAHSLDYCPAPPFVNKPYIRVYGGDIFAGINSGGSSDCPGWESNRDSGIYGFTDQTVADTATKGSGGQLGVLALGPIKAFSSAILRTVSPMPPYGLTASNDTATYGKLGIAHCQYDYWGNKPAMTPISRTGSQPNEFYNIKPNDWPTALGKQYMYFTGNVRMPSTSTAQAAIPAGQQRYMYVDGDVQINTSVTYSDSNWTTTGDTSKIPYFQLVATGNIYIAGAPPSGGNRSYLARLDGVYVAQGNSVTGDGIIYTCSMRNHNTINFKYKYELIKICSNPLTVYGSLIARKIKWNRTYGTASASTADESPSSTAHPCYGATSPAGYSGLAVPSNAVPAPASQQSVCAAEIINHSPDIWLGTLPTASSTSRYNYVQALPPML